MLRLSILTVIAVLAIAPGATAAPAPPNDNYLASTPINARSGALPRDYRDDQDTSTATVQADIFDPDKSGFPLGGGPPERTTCGSRRYGKTVWYDFVPRTAGAVEVVTAGFDMAVAVYEWDPSTSLITRRVLCQNDSKRPTEDVLLQRPIRRGAHYTVQIGGVNDTGGPLDFHFTFFPDRDGDGVLDEAPDKCPSTPGIEAFGGCPPLVQGTPRLAWTPSGHGLRVTRLVVDRMAKGGTAEARCRRCGRRATRKARRAGSLSLSGFTGRRLRAGDAIVLRITHARARSGRYRHGAIGHVFRWPITSSGLGARSDWCLTPGSNKRTSCP